MKGALLFLGLAWAALGLGQPVTMAARVQSNVWFVEGTMSGKATVFMIDTGADWSAILPSATHPEGPVDVQIKIGGLNFSTTALATKIFMLDVIKDQVGDRQVAMLGADVLRNLAIGFDYAKSEVTFWPRGRVDSKEALDWVKSPDAAPTKLDLNRNFGYLLGFAVTIGKWKGALLMDTGTTRPTLLAKHVEKVSAVEVGGVRTVLADSGSDEKVLMAPSLSAGRLQIPWFEFRNSEMTKDMEKTFGGAMSLSAFRSPRVIVDMVGETVFFAQPSSDTALSSVVSGLMETPLTVKSGVLKQDGAEVVSIAGRSAREILEALSGKGADPVAFLRELLAARKGDSSVVVKT